MSRREEAYRRAFVDVFGDPFAPEDIEGHYNMLLRRGEIAAMKNNFDEGRVTPNPARPNKIDFFVDVESVVKSVLKTKKEQAAFYLTYVEGRTDLVTDGKQRTTVELAVGAALLARGISPVSKYFTVVRQPVRT